MSSDFTPELLAGLWQERRPSGPLIAHTFRSTYCDRWVRFHSLPESKRYPESEDEYAIVLDRYNTILDELFAGTDVFVVTMDWSYTPTGPAGHPSPRKSPAAQPAHRLALQPPSGALTPAAGRPTPPQRIRQGGRSAGSDRS
ncbi:hypothetical protein [Streptomyces sp. NBC_01481]|uniref:DUF3885 domain-containing protein n=1 Tax=Streptomyces sp. NBC_01481 TaxID=2975869 RepID=UPI002257F6C0|nr:hypothetical protein [Streptomyces sp. NBC_01481]MCX4586630.1 hypothetical protein [Streptomyces sp. NBC_01481]